MYKLSVRFTAMSILVLLRHESAAVCVSKECVQTETWERQEEVCTIKSRVRSKLRGKYATEYFFPRYCVHSTHRWYTYRNVLTGFILACFCVICLVCLVCLVNIDRNDKFHRLKLPCCKNSTHKKFSVINVFRVCKHLLHEKKITIQYYSS